MAILSVSLFRNKLRILANSAYWAQFKERRLKKTFTYIGPLVSK